MGNDNEMERITRPPQNFCELKRNTKIKSYLAVTQIQSERSCTHISPLPTVLDA
jgi:hypothetical protein